MSEVSELENPLKVEFEAFKKNITEQVDALHSLNVKINDERIFEIFECIGVWVADNSYHTEQITKQIKDINNVIERKEKLRVSLITSEAYESFLISIILNCRDILYNVRRIDVDKSLQADKVERLIRLMFN